MVGIEMASSLSLPRTLSHELALDRDSSMAPGDATLPIDNLS